MEGQVTVASGARSVIAAALSLLIGVPASWAQNAGERAAEPGQFTLRKSAQSREYKGQEYEGEDRTISAGDSLWRILVKEKGLPETRFGQALIIIRGLNPQIKQLDVLRVGESVFIPLQPDAPLPTAASAVGKKDEARTTTGRATVRDYRVQLGDSLYQVLRDHVGVRGDRELQQYYALVKDLNPERKNWDVLLVGDVIRLPERVRGEDPSGMTSNEGMASNARGGAAAEAKGVITSKVVTPKTITADYPKRLPARENVALVMQVMEALGIELEQGGEEILALNDGTVRLDRSAYPVVSNPKLHQRVVLDAEDKIPATLKARMSDPNAPMGVVALTRNSSVKDSVEQIIARLGYQSLPGDRPVVMQHDGVTFEAKGHWVALAPEEDGKAQEIFVINLSQSPSEIPDYLKQELSLKGLNLKEIVLGSGRPAKTAVETEAERAAIPPIKYWPREKREFVDALLSTLRVASDTPEGIRTQLRDGLSIELQSDRVIEKDGKRTAIFFKRIDPAFKSALQDREKMRVVEIDLAGSDHKSIAARLLTELGDPSSYQEHRFSIGGQQEPVQIKAWGFLLSNRNLFITDRDIPPPLYRFFFEKGLEIIYF